LSLAIGKKGQNVRLAAKLTGWKIDIKSEEEKRREVEAQFMDFALPGDVPAEGAGAAEGQAEDAVVAAEPAPEPDTQPEPAEGEAPAGDGQEQQ
jgi:hypothetical protein